jgi:uncharacterized protein YjdB
MAHLFIIAGHGAGDCGAVGYGYTEAERVRALASRLSALGGGNVTVADMNRNWYADNGIMSLNIPKDWQILELHMDSAGASAKGGHVIINSAYSADQYDTALASFIGSFFPGRAKNIVPRSDLANPNRAAARGYSYRLLENGFITNSGDLNKFNSQMDDLARGILNAFGIATASPAKEDSDGKVTSGGTSQDSVQHYGKVSYQSHIRDIGWACWQSDGRMSGTTGQNRRIEAFRLVPVGETDVVVHIKDVGDKEFKNINKDTILGTTGQNKRIEAIKITGKETNYAYRVHQKNIGWSAWTFNGNWCGVKGEKLQIEAIEITKAKFLVAPYVQNKGWLQDSVCNNAVGITGHNLRLEAFKINPLGMDIGVKAHIQDKGWVDYGTINKDTVIGTTNESKRIECLCFKGDFEYRVHIQNSGWTNWTKADGVATLGTVGQALRIEAIQFR